VLQPGGVLRIIVPDAERYLRAYCDGGWDTLAQLRPLDAGRIDRFFGCRYRTKLELINQVFRQGHAHKYAYDYETLEFLLHRYGFSQVERREFGQSRLAELFIDQPRRASESLYVEAVKD
jgi:predicted SAM-dependent methyltransferase